MRVITGTARGRKLLEPVGMDIRPTTDQVKEALFNILQFDIEGRNVLDMFGGTGQLGIEALSRGAASCLFLDQSKSAVDIIRENLKRCELNGSVVRADSIGYLHAGMKFDIIFIDPPYGYGTEAEALKRIQQFDILTTGGIMCIETRPETVIPTVLPEYGNTKIYRYGKIKLTIITRS